LAAYEKNDGNAFPEQRGTAYNLLNAVTEYTDHTRSTRGNGNGRSESAMFGSGERLKAQAVDVIVEAAGGMPTVAGATIYARRPIEPAPGGLLEQIIAQDTAA
jgi:hypothetical protein